MQHGSGEARRLLDGVHHNLLRTGTHSDPTFEGTVAAYDWLCLGSALQRELDMTHNYRAFLPLLPFIACGVHVAASSPLRPALSFPLLDGKTRMAARETQAVLRDLQAAVPKDVPAARLSQTTMLLELVPFILDIISPHMESASQSARYLSQEDSDRVRRIVAVMFNHGIVYVQQRRMRFGPMADASAFAMKPNLPLLGKWCDRGMEGEGVEPLPSFSTFHHELADPTKDFIKHELQLEKVRRADAKRATVNAVAQSQAGGAGEGSITLGERSTVPISLIETMKAREEQDAQRKRRAKAGTVAASAPKRAKKDFFGRVIREREATEAEQVVAAAASAAPKITYQFQEGMTNAVRNTLFMSHFYAAAPIH